MEMIKTSKSNQKQNTNPLHRDDYHPLDPLYIHLFRKNKKEKIKTNKKLYV